MSTLYSNADATESSRVIIEEQTVAAAMFSTVTIPSGYRTIDLILTGMRSPASAYYDTIKLTLNGNTTDTDYKGILTGAVWSTTGGVWAPGAYEFNTRPSEDIPAASSRATDNQQVRVTLSDYDQTTYYKTVLGDRRGVLQESASNTYYFWNFQIINMFPSTAAITTVAFSLTSGEATLTTGRLQVVGYK